MVHYMRAWTLVAIHVLLRSVRPDALCDAKGGVRRCRDGFVLATTRRSPDVLANPVVARFNLNLFFVIRGRAPAHDPFVRTVL